MRSFHKLWLICALATAAIAADSGGKVFFADICPEQIHKVSNGTITTVAGNGQLSPLKRRPIHHCHVRWPEHANGNAHHHP